MRGSKSRTTTESSVSRRVANCVGTYGAVMDLIDALRANPAARSFTATKVDDATIASILDVARFAPSGGNRQPWRVAVVSDVELRTSLAALCAPVWWEYVAGQNDQFAPFSVAKGAPADPAADDIVQVPNPILDDIGSVPVLLVIAADLKSLAMMDKDLDRPPITGGGSVYPFVWSILLAARAHDLAGVMTTFLARAEREARQLLGLPDDWAIASMVCLGEPTTRPTRLRRNPVASFATRERFDGPAFG